MVAGSDGSITRVMPYEPIHRVSSRKKGRITEKKRERGEEKRVRAVSSQSRYNQRRKANCQGCPRRLKLPWESENEEQKAS